VIAYESFRLSSAVTGSWLWEILKLAHVHLSAESFSALHHFLRKAGHLTGYGLLCILLFRSWFHTLQDSGENDSAVNNAQPGTRDVRWHCAILSLTMTLITAVLDELHQSLDLSRTGTPWDVALDLTGAVLFLFIAVFGLRLWQRRPVKALEEVSA
jgi:VanZ family protein